MLPANFDFRIGIAVLTALTLVASTLGNAIFALVTTLLKKFFGDSRYFKGFNANTWHILSALVLVVGFSTVVFAAVNVLTWWLGQEPRPHPVAQVTPPPSSIPPGNQTPPPHQTDWPRAKPISTPIRVAAVTSNPAPLTEPSFRRAIPVGRPKVETAFPSPGSAPEVAPEPTAKPRPTKPLGTPDGHGGWYSPFPDDLEFGHQRDYPRGKIEYVPDTPLVDKTRHRIFYTY